MPRLARAASLSIALLSILAAEGHGFQNSPTPPCLPAIRERMRPFIEDKEIAGAVTLVATPDRIVHLDATGKADIATGKPMRPDTIFWIASMTKPITATAVLMLQDEGKLSVDDPVEKYLPEFKGLKTADGKPARVTIRHLLTHTSGMGETSAAEARGIKDLAGLIPLYVAKPVQFEPGSKWAYCQSGINTAARIVEVVSGVPFDRVRRAAAVRPAGDEGHDLLPHRGAAPAARHVVPPDRRGRARTRRRSASWTARPRRAATASRRPTAACSPRRRITPGSAG